MFKEFCLLFFFSLFALTLNFLYYVMIFILFISCCKIFLNICSALLKFVLYLLCTILFHLKIHFFKSLLNSTKFYMMSAILFCVAFYFSLNFSELMIISLWNHFVCVYFLPWSVNSLKTMNISLFTLF